MEHYYLGGYYLIRQKPIVYWDNELLTVNSASSCFNQDLLDTWSFYTVSGQDLEMLESEFLINREKVKVIQDWVYEAQEMKRIGLPNLFFNLETLYEYKNSFFSHLPGLKIFEIDFTAPFLEKLIAALEPSERYGTIGLYQNAKRRILEQEHYRQMTLGYDMIGIEPHGGFHTFYCHCGAASVAEQLNLSVNEYGLFNDHDNWEAVMEHVNEHAPFEPVPWLSCKVKVVG